MSQAATVETPSGKTSKDENFPVGSWLLPKALRPHVATFYAFARAADDIADDGFLTAEEKVARLDGFEAALTGKLTGDPAYEKAYAMRRSLALTGSTPRHCIDLLAAFKQDATKLRYRDWDDLMGYCYLSASPVGRYLLDLHGERRTLYPVADALCNALQILNHLQDCQKDYRQLDRVYLPGDWLAAEGATVEDLDRSAATPGLRRVIDRTLDGIDALMAEAVMLPKVLSNARLSMESAVTVNLALRLARHLRRGDPVAGRVALTKLDFARCGAAGILQGFLR